MRLPPQTDGGSWKPKSPSAQKWQFQLKDDGSSRSVVSDQIALSNYKIKKNSKQQIPSYKSKTNSKQQLSRPFSGNDLNGMAKRSHDVMKKINAFEQLSLAESKDSSVTSTQDMKRAMLNAGHYNPRFAGSSITKGDGARALHYYAKLEDRNAATPFQAPRRHSSDALPKRREESRDLPQLSRHDDHLSFRNISASTTGSSGTHSKSLRLRTEQTKSLFDQSLQSPSKEHPFVNPPNIIFTEEQYNVEYHVEPENSIVDMSVDEKQGAPTQQRVIQGEVVPTKTKGFLESLPALPALPTINTNFLQQPCSIGDILKEEPIKKEKRWKIMDPNGGDTDWYEYQGNSDLSSEMASRHHRSRRTMPPSYYPEYRRRPVEYTSDERGERMKQKRNSKSPRHHHRHRNEDFKPRTKPHESITSSITGHSPALQSNDSSLQDTATPSEIQDDLWRRDRSAQERALDEQYAMARSYSSDGPERENRRRKEHHKSRRQQEEDRNDDRYDHYEKKRREYLGEDFHEEGRLQSDGKGRRSSTPKSKPDKRAARTVERRIPRKKSAPKQHQPHDLMSSSVSWSEADVKAFVKDRKRNQARDATHHAPTPKASNRDGYDDEVVERQNAQETHRRKKQIKRHKRRSTPPESSIFPMFFDALQNQRHSAAGMSCDSLRARGTVVEDEDDESARLSTLSNDEFSGREKRRSLERKLDEVHWRSLENVEKLRQLEEWGQNEIPEELPQSPRRRDRDHSPPQRTPLSTKQRQSKGRKSSRSQRKKEDSRPHADDSDEEENQGDKHNIPASGSALDDIAYSVVSPKSVDNKKQGATNTKPKYKDEGLSGNYMYTAYSKFANDPREVVQLCEHRLPPTPTKGEMFVKVLASTVTNSDCQIRRGEWNDVALDPFIIPGTAFAGAIQQTRNSKKGVFSSWKPGDFVLGLVKQGGNSRFLCVGWDQMVKAPQHLNAGSLACLPETYLSAFQALHLGQRGQMRYRESSLEGRSILVTGGFSSMGRAVVELALLGGVAFCYVLTKEKHFEWIRGIGGIPLSRDPQEWLTLIGNQISMVVTVKDGSVHSESLTRDHVKALHPEGRVVFMGSPGAVYNLARVVQSPTSSKLLCKSAKHSRLEDRTHTYNVFDAWEQDAKQCRRDLEHLVFLLSQDLIQPEILEQIPLSKVAKAQSIVESKKLSGHIICTPWIQERLSYCFAGDKNNAGMTATTGTNSKSGSSK